MGGDLNGKVAIVLGATTADGMGQAIARRLAAEGAKVVVSGRSEEGLRNVSSEIGGAYHVADITQEADIASLVRYTTDTFGGLHIAVNAVGVSGRVPFRELTEEHLLAMAKLHFVGPALFIKHVAEAIVDDGAIVNISSLSAYDPIVGISAYAASKRAGDRMVEAAAVEYRAKRLRINAVIPSLVPTPLSRLGISEFGMDPVAFEQTYADLTPLGRVARPEDIAAFVYMLVRDEFFETGQLLHCSGGNSLLGTPRYFARR
jgi:NAD(P)-dependent dehydrogenase (short-subunit alcohol dehydrogenase family)